MANKYGLNLIFLFAMTNMIGYFYSLFGTINKIVYI